MPRSPREKPDLQQRFAETRLHPSPPDQLINLSVEVARRAAAEGWDAEETAEFMHMLGLEAHPVIARVLDRHGHHLPVAS